MKKHLKAKVNVVQFQQKLYPLAHLTEIYEHRVVPQKSAHLTLRPHILAIYRQKLTGKSPI